MNINNNYENIIEIFSYSSEEQNVFPYINKYMILINSHLNKYKLTEKQLVRFMLIGFFLDYRASCHHGSIFSTISNPPKELLDQDFVNDFNTKFGSIMTTPMTLENANYFSNITTEKCKYYNSLRKRINNTNEYIKLIGIPLIENIDGLSMYNYVISGPDV